MPVKSLDLKQSSAAQLLFRNRYRRYVRLPVEQSLVLVNGLRTVGDYFGNDGLPKLCIVGLSFLHLRFQHPNTGVAQAILSIAEKLMRFACKCCLYDYLAQ